MREQNIPDRGISINEAIGLLDLEDEINLEEIIQEQTTSVKQSMLEGGIINDFNHSISFVIPLTTYVPLPEPYHASMVGVVPGSNPIVMSSVSVVSVISKLVNLSFGEKSIPVRISILVASVSIKEHEGVLENPNKLHDAYLDAIRASNDVISS